ncbi:MAG TPA: hypothetical protein VJ715_08880 [Pyrinomonadaceae bacterium]|nr:hypothetical protein [Pyrinomonadaceae bacterium]
MRSPVSGSLVHGVTMLALAGLYIFFTPRVEAANGPFNGKIAFVSTRDYATGSYEIYTMNANGTSQVNISNNPAQDTAPSWSPDGTKIAFQSDRDGNFEIYVMNADGSNPTRLTFNSLGDENPVWSPDGTKIAFQSDRDDPGNCNGGGCVYHPDIYVMNSDGTGTVRLTNHPAKDGSPSWSPDGTKIAFQSDRDGNFEIYLMNADGSGQTRLTNSNTAHDFSPAFSPDGTKIVVDNGNQVFVMNADGTGQTQLTSSGVSSSAAFSPDGKKITFESPRDGAGYEIYAMNADGSNQTRLSDSPGDNLDPAWQPVPKIDTVGVFRPSTGQFLLRNSNSAGPANITVNFGQAGDQPLAGDWNGDGLDDVGVFRNGQFRLRQPVFFNGQPTNVVTTIDINFGAPGDLAIVGDWNGDGIDTPGVFRPSTGQFLITNSANVDNSTPRAVILNFSGNEGDKPVAGDWNNDGRDTVGVYRESAACAFLLTNNNFSIGIIATGFCAAPPVSPVMGDWNGNGVDTNGVYSGSQSAFLLSNNLTGPPEFQFRFGLPGDLPVAGDWNGGNP